MAVIEPALLNPVSEGPPIGTPRVANGELLAGLFATGMLLLLVFALNVTIWLAIPLAVATYAGLVLLRPPLPRLPIHADVVIGGEPIASPASLPRPNAVLEPNPSPPLLMRDQARDLVLPLDGTTASVPDKRRSAVPPTHQNGTSAAGFFTPRQYEVLRLINAGRSNQQIAETLFISPRTVPHHTKAIFDKLGVSSRTAAIAEARRRGLL